MTRYLYYLLFLLLLFTTSVSAKWDELNAANVPGDVKASYSFSGGHLLVNCTAKDNPFQCDVSLDAKVSDAGVFKVQFDVCTKSVDVSFSDDPLLGVPLRRGMLKLRTIVSVSLNGKVTSDPDLSLLPLRGPIKPDADSIVKVGVDLPLNCSFTLLEGKAFVRVPDTTEASNSKESSLSTLAIGGIVAGCVVLVIIIAAVLVYCFYCKEKLKKKKQDQALKESHLNEAKNGAKEEDKFAVVNESKDVKVADADKQKTSELKECATDSKKDGSVAKQFKKRAKSLDAPKEVKTKPRTGASVDRKVNNVLPVAATQGSEEQEVAAKPSGKLPKRRSKSGDAAKPVKNKSRTSASIERKQVDPTQDATLSLAATQEYKTMSVDDLNEKRAKAAAVKLIKNKRFKVLYEPEECIVPVTKTIDGVMYWLLPSADDARETPDDCKHIMERWVVHFKATKTVPVYYRFGETTTRWPFHELQIIEINSRQYFEEGPARITSNMIQDGVAIDFMVKYLSSCYIIDDDGIDKMSKILGPYDPQLSTKLEISFLTSNFDDATSTWKALLDEGKEYMEKNRHRKSDLPALYEFLKKDSMFHRLCWFYELFSKYLSRFPLKPHHFVRVPLQGLMMLLMRPDLTPEMEYKILMWFKVTSFALMRREDVGLTADVIAYPLNIMAKLWYRHDFTRVTAEEVDKMRQLLDFDEPAREDDWEVYDSVPGGCPIK